MTAFSDRAAGEALPDLENIASSTLKNSVAPLANEIDSNPKILQQALMSLGEKGLLALRIPQKWGGYAASDRSFFNYQEMVARASGALAFLEIQHQSAALMIASSKNLQLQELYLPKLSRGEMLLGVGFSQIRRQGKPSVKAIPIPGGYEFKGLVPWVTGWGIFDEFIVAGILPGGEAMFALVPFVKTVNPRGSIQFSEPMGLCGMNSTNTVTATVENWFVPEERVVSIKPPGRIHENDKNKVLKATALNFGCAEAGVDILENALKVKSLDFIREAIASFKAEINDCRNAIWEAQENPDLDFNKKLELRAAAIELAVRCATAAVTVSSGAANRISHPAQRIYREAMVYVVFRQTTAVMEATLDRLKRG